MTSGFHNVLITLIAIATGTSAVAGEAWWAFQPLAEVAPPPVTSDHVPLNGIDHFVIHRLGQREMTPAPPADRATLLRRLYHDLIGLPPTPDEIDSFLEDSAPNAWERRVDALLDDVRYGEHWATMWLDLVRYSESDGWNQDAYRPHIWRYRDYVVNAFNEDKAFPDFVREQLAGDEMPVDDPDRLDAAGFLRLGIYEYNQRDARGHWDDVMNEMTDTAGDVFLGLSVACARCHDHKFDDITQKDYFRLRAFFEPVIWRDDLKAATQAQRSAYEKQLITWKEATGEIRAEIDALLQPYHDRKWVSTVDKFPLDIQACFHKPENERNSREHQMAYLVSRQFLEEGGGPLKSMSKEDEARYASLKEALAAYDHLKPEPLPPVMTVTTFKGPHAPTIIPDTKGPAEVSPGYLSALAKLTEPVVHPERPRTALAEWISDPENPLSTRVIVNRVWQQHFERGLVDTANDFGRKGSPPSHPDLLDWLTREFINQGWSFKQLHRLILTSATWRQSSHHPQAQLCEKRDPEEALLWRAPVRRLQAEAIRDSMLYLSGELLTKAGGPSVDGDVPRRALYVKRFRNDNDTFLHAFDMSPGLKSMAQRNCTTTPTQSLTMINGEYVLDRARKWAGRLREDYDDTSALLHNAMRSAWGRQPAPEEMQSAHRFLGDAAEPETSKLIDFCHVLFNSNEFLYIR